MTVYALTIHFSDDNAHVWAFDSLEQYNAAIWHCARHNIPMVYHHGIDRQNKPFPLGKEQTDEEWIAKSHGLNDADEVERCIYEHGRNLPGLDPLNPDNAPMVGP